jgi:hypothetical protein
VSATFVADVLTLAMWLIIVVVPAAFVWFAFGPMLIAKGKKRAREVDKTPRNALGIDWGALPVVKITGDHNEARHVETRRIVSPTTGQDALEVRLYVGSECVESRRFAHEDFGKAIGFHDSLVNRNGANPNHGAAPEWHSIGRVRVLKELGIPEPERQAQEDLAKHPVDPNAPVKSPDTRQLERGELLERD